MEASFFMCFFVNNQYRILDGTGDMNGSDSLGSVFESNLLRIGRVVALLDTYHEPIYLTRIWTIFEQFTALKLGVPMEMVLPPQVGKSMLAEFAKGEEGVLRVVQSVANVDSSTAKATVNVDEERVKQMIIQSVGFHEVDVGIRSVMVGWVSAELRNYLEGLVHSCIEGNSYMDMRAIRSSENFDTDMSNV